MTRFIGICGSKGGIGKTTIALNLGNVLTRLKKKAVVIDADFASPDIATYFNTNLETPINRVLEGKEKILDIINKTEAGLYYTTACHKMDSLHDKNIIHFYDAISPLIHNFEFVIVDTGSTLSQTSMIPYQACNEMIIVTEPNLLSVKEALRTKKAIEGFSRTALGVIINKKANEKFEMSKEEIRDILNVPVLGEISYDKIFRDCMHNNLLSTDYSIHTKSSKEIANVAKHLIRN